MDESIKVPKSDFDVVLGRMLKAKAAPMSVIAQAIEQRGKSKPKKPKPTPLAPK